MSRGGGSGEASELRGDEPLASHAQIHACSEIDRLKLPVFDTAIQQRAAYMEIGLSGLPPHFAEQGRATVSKAATELDNLVDEIAALSEPRARTCVKGAA